MFKEQKTEKKIHNPYLIAKFLHKIPQELKVIRAMLQNAYI